MKSNLVLSAAAIALATSLTNAWALSPQSHEKTSEQRDSEFQATVQSLVDLGVVRMDPATGEANIDLDILKALQTEGKLKIKVVGESQICGGGKS
jgi:hypothetical protein